MNMSGIMNNSKTYYNKVPESESDFTIHIYESEYKRIQEWTEKFPNIETGGDLFGLWRDDHTAVVQLVLGPGQQCRRTAVSFYQDVEYLDRVGNHLTHNEGLCHIGEWHSHHKLGLTRPSGGDENTVWSNMHRYKINRFCLFISTIGHSKGTRKGAIEVQVNGYLFEIDKESNREFPILSSSFESMKGNSPFRISNEKEITEGAESLNPKMRRVDSFNDQYGIQHDKESIITDDQPPNSPVNHDYLVLRICKGLHTYFCFCCIASK